MLIKMYQESVYNGKVLLYNIPILNENTHRNIIMTTLEIIAAMEAELKALNVEVAEIEQNVNDLETELDSMEKDYK